MKILKKQFLKSNFFLGLILSLILLWPLVVAPYFSHHDDVVTIRIYEMHQCFVDHQLPCRWVPDLGGLYGYPLFNYYAPLPYYVGEFFYLITQNLLISAKFIFAISMIGSYIFMFLLGRKLWGSLGGMLSGVFYSFAPYHAVDLYVRGALGELWGLMFLPAIIWGLFRLKEKPNIFNSLILALFLAGVFLSHNLSVMMFAPAILAFFVLLFWQKREKQFLIGFFASGVLAICLAAFYLFPVLSEQHLVHVETTVSGYFSYTEHFKGLKKLFLETSWGWGASVREVDGAKDDMSFQIGLVHVLGWLLSIPGIFFYWKKKRFLSGVLILLNLSILGAIVMIHPRSIFIWSQIDSLKYLQFPWRFLTVVIFCISLMVGVIPNLYKRYKKTDIIFLILIVAVVLFNIRYFRPEKFQFYSDQELLHGALWDKQIKRSIYDYLPKSATAPPAELATAPYEILAGDTTVENFQKGTDWFKFDTTTQNHTIIRISQYYFPNWKIFIDGKEVVIDYKNNSLGLMTVILGDGKHHIEGKLYNTSIRTAANTLSLISVILFFVILIFQSKKFRQRASYYLKAYNR